MPPQWDHPERLPFTCGFVARISIPPEPAAVRGAPRNRATASLRRHYRSALALRFLKRSGLRKRTPAASAVFRKELNAGCLHGAARLGTGFVRYPEAAPSLNALHRWEGEPGSRPRSV